MTWVRPLLVKWLPIFLIASLAMHFLIDRALELDEAAPTIRSFAATNQRIQSEVGAVQEIDIVKSVYVSATSSAGAYRLYTVNVRGATASITAVIRLEANDGEGIATATLESVFR